MSNVSRRAVLSTGGRAAVATLSLGGVSVAASGEDAELRRLWATYLGQLERIEALHVPYQAALDAFDAEWGPAPWDKNAPFRTRAEEEAWREAWDAHSPKEYDAWSDACSVEHRLIEQIQAATATTLFGIGIKLTAIFEDPQEEDYREAVESALADIQRLTGHDFTAELSTAGGQANA